MEGREAVIGFEPNPSPGFVIPPPRSQLSKLEVTGRIELPWSFRPLTDLQSAA